MTTAARPNTPTTTRPYILGVTGGSASGKTTFLRRLLDAFGPGQVTMVSLDHYYRTIDQVPVDANGIQNFDLPQAIDVDLFCEHVRSLRGGNAVHKREYTFNNPLIEPAMLTFWPAPVLVLEGIFTLYYPEVCELLDLKVYIDAEEPVKLRRRIQRDNRERGYDLDDVLYRYEHHVSPTYERYVKPYRAKADIVIPNNEGFERGLRVLADHLRVVVASSEVPMHVGG